MKVIGSEPLGRATTTAATALESDTAARLDSYEGVILIPLAIEE